MPKRRPERDRAREIWTEAGGKRTAKSIGEELGVSVSLVRKWKSQDKWTLPPPKKPRGAPKGNHNAKGNKGGTGAKPGNRQAETHRANSRPDLSRMTPEQLGTLEEIQDQMLRGLVAKYLDLENRIAALRETEQERFVTGGIDGANPVEYWDSRIKWIETLEQRSLKILSRIQKFMDQKQAEKSLEIHAEISREQLKLQREKAQGIFEEEEDQSSGGE